MAVIVVGVDGSAAAEHALWYAAGLASRQGLELVAVHVRRRPPAGFGELTPVAVARATVEEHERQTLALVREAAGQTGARWSFVVRDGAIAAEVHTVAVERDASLIVVGTRGDGIGARLRRLAHGSVSTRLARREPIPVLVVR